MAARKGSKKPSRASLASPKSSLYLGCFFFDSYLNDQDHTGTFQMVVGATSPEQAVDRFHSRLRAIRRIGSVLSGPSTVFIQGIIPLDGSFEQAVLVNYESRPSPDPPDYQLLNMTPEQGVKGLGSYELSKEDDTIQPFIDFGGQAHNRALEAKKAAPPPYAQVKARSSPEEAAKARAEKAEQKARRAAESAKRKDERETIARVKARRDQALGATLAEMGKADRRR